MCKTVLKRFINRVHSQTSKLYREDSLTLLKGCDSNIAVNMYIVLEMLQIKQLPCIKQYVLG